MLLNCINDQIMLNLFARAMLGEGRTLELIVAVNRPPNASLTTVSNQLTFDVDLLNLTV